MPMPPVSSTSTPSLTHVNVTQGSQGTADTALSLVSISNSNYAGHTRRFFIENLFNNQYFCYIKKVKVNMLKFY